jgi:hypothetical protein
MIYINGFCGMIPGAYIYAMKKLIIKISLIAGVLIVFVSKEIRAQYIPAEKIFQQSFNLIPPHSLDTQYYSMESRLTKISPDGTTEGTDVYRLYLRKILLQEKVMNIPASGLLFSKTILPKREFPLLPIGIITYN